MVLNAGYLGLIPGLGRSHGERKGYPLQYSGLENSMDCIVHRVAKSQTWLSDFHFHISTVVFEKTFESPLHCKEIKPGNQSWIFIGRTDAEAKAPILWAPDAKSQLTGKDPDAGKDWRQEKGMRRRDGWMASPTQWTWVWASSRRWW